jgi:hypothetical protein
MWSALQVSNLDHGNDFFGEMLKAAPIEHTSESSALPYTKSATPDPPLEVRTEDDWDVDGWEDIRPGIQHFQASFKPPPLPRPIDARLKERHDQLTDIVLEELREYMLNFADPRATEELNDDLNEKSFASLANYYSAKPELIDYTIDQEGIC